MHFILNDEAALAAGRHTLNSYAKGLLCGRGTEAFDTAMRRSSGVELLPGAFQACLDLGIHDEIDLVAAASRATRVRGQTGIRVLQRLSQYPSGLFVADRNGYYLTRAEWDEYAV